MAGRTPTVRPRIMAYLVENIGKPVTAEKIQAATGLETDQIQAQMRNMINEGHNVQVITRGRIWVYSMEPTSEPEPERDTSDVTGDVFEGVGRTRSGAIIVRDMSGILYVCREMDV